MSAHSKFLVHWTGGQDIEKEYACDTPDYVNQYINRLKAIISYGLLMKRGREKIYGSQNTWVEAINPRVCFTEIRLSQAKKHADDYGKLGIGLTREFVMAKLGNPVFYVQNGRTGMVIHNVDKLRGNIEELKRSSQLREYARNAETALTMVMTFLKGMSIKDGQDLSFYDEMEWRIVHTDQQVEQGVFVPHPDNANEFYLPLTPKDVALLVFPSEPVKQAAMNDTVLQKKLFDSHVPVIATLDDCKDF